MTFFGTQPTLTQVPPRRAASMTTARAPYSAARCAQASPPLPPPMTARSCFSGISHSTHSYNIAMSNPLLSGELLPRFDAIRPEHVEPAIRSLLGENRVRIAQLAADATPSFARVVEPL